MVLDEVRSIATDVQRVSSAQGQNSRISEELSSYVKTVESRRTAVRAFEFTASVSTTDLTTPMPSSASRSSVGNRSCLAARDGRTPLPTSEQHLVGRSPQEVPKAVHLIPEHARADATCRTTACAAVHQHASLETWQDLSKGGRRDPARALSLWFPWAEPAVAQSICSADQADRAGADAVACVKLADASQSVDALHKIARPHRRDWCQGPKGVSSALGQGQSVERGRNKRGSAPAAATIGPTGNVVS